MTLTHAGSRSLKVQCDAYRCILHWKSHRSQCHMYHMSCQLCLACSCTAQYQSCTMCCNCPHCHIHKTHNRCHWLGSMYQAKQQNGESATIKEYTHSAVLHKCACKPHLPQKTAIILYIHTWHTSHVRPCTLSWHGHCPLAWWHTSDVEPMGSQLHSVCIRRSERTEWQGDEDMHACARITDTITSSRRLQ